MNPDYGPLFRPPDPPDNPGDNGKVDGMQRADDSANSEWKAAALKSVHHRATHCDHVTANDVFSDLELLGLFTHENRALGSVFQKAARMQWIAKTNTTVASTRSTRHSGDVRVWRSLICKVPA